VDTHPQDVGESGSLGQSRMVYECALGGEPIEMINRVRDHCETQSMQRGDDNTPIPLRRDSRAVLERGLTRDIEGVTLGCGSQITPSRLR
jgi:hypothetical protein